MDSNITVARSNPCKKVCSNSIHLSYFEGQPLGINFQNYFESQDDLENERDALSDCDQTIEGCFGYEEFVRDQQLLNLKCLYFYIYLSIPCHRSDPNSLLHSDLDSHSRKLDLTLMRQVPGLIIDGSYSKIFLKVS